MKAAWYEKKGPAREVLNVGETLDPIVGIGDVLVQVRASAVNPSDTKGRGGYRGNIAMQWPRIIPHQDGAGVIIDVGEGVPRSRIGERVWIYEAQLGRPDGTAAELVSLPAANTVSLPENTSFVEGACLGVPAVTAHRCVFANGPVAGKTVLVTGGAGAVGFYAIQFAAHAGAQVVATVSDDQQAELARSAGARTVINRHSQDIVSELGEKSIDRIVEVAFGSNLLTSIKLIRPNGTIATYASDAEWEPKIPFWPMVGLNLTVHFVLVYVMDKDAHEQAISAVTQGLTEGWLKHNIGHRLGLDQIAKAHELVEMGPAHGKVVLEL